MTPWLLPAAAASLWFGLLVHPTPVALAIAVGVGLLLWFTLCRVVQDLSLIRIGVVVLIACCVGSFWGTFRTEAVSRGVLATTVPASVVVEGALRTDPEAGAFGWHAILHTSVIRSGDLAVRATEATWIEGTGTPPSALRGDRIQIVGSVQAPTDEGFGSYLRSIGVGSTLAIETVKPLGPSENPLLRLAAWVRSALRDRFESLFPPREAGLLMGLALGDRSNIDAALERDFQATGLTHLLAVSGGNLAMVVAPVLGLLAALGVAPSIRIAVGVGVVAFFVVLTGAEPSVLRAGVMALLTLGAMALGRPRAAWPILGGSVLVLLILDPFLSASVGFQLSVGATAGIVTFATAIAQRLTVMPRPIAIALGTTIGAQLGVGPLLLFYFHWLPLSSILANLLAFPLVEPAMLLGLAAAGLHGPLPAVATLLASIDLGLMRGLQWLADSVATIPMPSLTSSGGWLGLVVSTAVVFLLSLWLRGGLRIPKPMVGCAALIFPVLLWSSGLGAGPPEGLTVRFLDIGQGDAALVRSPGGATILIDAGPDEDAVAVRLAELGVRRLDAVVATHQHADHVEGFPQVLARFPVGVVLEPGCSDDSPSYAAFLQAVKDEQLESRFPRTGDAFDIGDIHLEVVSPSSCFEGTHSDPNNDSIVFRLSVAEDAVLFTGDAEVEAQEVMLSTELSALPTQVLKVPHHGGDTSAAGFFEAVAPDYAIISVGQDNGYGHPVPEVVAALEASGAEVLRTDQLGDVTVEFSHEGLRVAA